MTGPLHGLRVLELAGIGPGPFAAMMLADLGADVVRVEGRTSPVGIELDRRFDTLLRSRTTISLNLKDPADRATALELVRQADVLLEGWRPGVAERLGIGPEVCLGLNEKLVYGRMTGYGQDGPMRLSPGHDINYIAVSGVLHMCGRNGQAPTPPLNLAGDFGGGGLFLAFGILAALTERQRSGLGQVVDSSMVDGSAVLATVFAGLFAAGLWSDVRGTNLVDSGAPYYDAYETLDGKFMAAGAIEARFRDEMYRVLGLVDLAGAPDDPATWPALKERVAAAFRTRTRAEWTDLFEGVEACVSPVLSPEEAVSFEHNAARSTFVEVDGIAQAAPAPRFSRTPADLPLAPSQPVDPEVALKRWVDLTQEGMS